MALFGMAILFAIIVFVFLGIGAFAFVLCVGVPRFRAGGLGAALWFATWGPCVIAWLVFAGLVAVANSLVSESIRFHRPPPTLPAHLTGWLVFGMMLVANSLTATAIVWLHHLLVHRMTYALFRLYATVVVAGIGSVWADLATVCWVSYDLPHPIVFWIAATFVLTVLAGALAYRHAGALRGRAPERYTWITAEEFNGAAARGDSAI
jgi:hypothetical protein